MKRFTSLASGTPISRACVMKKGWMGPEEVQARRNGIVYIKLAAGGPMKNNTTVMQVMKPHIACLGMIHWWSTQKKFQASMCMCCGVIVNSAGLVNTNDVLVHYGGFPINFIDTGGEATKDMIKECFRLILLDNSLREGSRQKPSSTFFVGLCFVIWLPLALFLPSRSTVSSWPVPSCCAPQENK